MADKIGYTGALFADGRPIPLAFTDNGDGSYTPGAAGAGAVVAGYTGALDATGVPIPIAFTDNGDGTYSEMVA